MPGGGVGVVMAEGSLSFFFVHSRCVVGLEPKARRGGENKIFLERFFVCLFVLQQHIMGSSFSSSK